jgi:hypothetical protein
MTISARNLKIWSCAFSARKRRTRQLRGWPTTPKRSNWRRKSSFGNATCAFHPQVRRDAVGELRGARVTIRDVTSTLFEIKARVIGDIKTLTNITSRHVEMKRLEPKPANRDEQSERMGTIGRWSPSLRVNAEAAKTYSVIAACHIACGSDDHHGAQRLCRAFRQTPAAG